MHPNCAASSLRCTPNDANHTATTSLQVDFAHQRRVELDYTAGAVLRRAQESGIPTPTLQTLYLPLKSRAQSFGGL